MVDSVITQQKQTITAVMEPRIKKSSVAVGAIRIACPIHGYILIEISIYTDSP
jgi:hypothetical protein